MLGAFRQGPRIIAYSTVPSAAAALYLAVAYTDSIALMVYSPVLLAGCGLLTFSLSTGLTDLFVQVRRRQWLLRFLPRAVAEGIERGDIRLELGGVEREVAVLLADLREFTTLAESRDPAEVLAILNEHFATMAAVPRRGSARIGSTDERAIATRWGMRRGAGEMPVTRPGAEPGTRLRLAVAWRPVPARAGEEHAVTRLLRERGFDVLQTEDAHLDLDALDVVLVLENARWFPAIVRDLVSRAGRRPRLVVWHWEPLPLPRSAGVPRPRLHLKELVKVALRDPRVTDVYSNLAELKRLRRLGVPDLLVVSSRAWQESLAEEEIPSEFLPYGFEHAVEPPARGARDVEALFLGALDVPRRRRIVRRLRRRGVDLTALGSWHSPDLWGRARTGLIQRADAFLNLQRYAGQMSMDRLLLGMVGKALVVSEPIYRPEPFVRGEHYVEAEVDEMPEVLAYYRRNRDERDLIVDRAHRFVTGELSMDASLGRLISLLPGRVSAGRR